MRRVKTGNAFDRVEVHLVAQGFIEVPAVGLIVSDGLAQ